MPVSALEHGRHVAVSDVLVTWVFTDVVGSTKLWEDYPEDMDKVWCVGHNHETPYRSIEKHSFPLKEWLIKRVLLHQLGLPSMSFSSSGNRHAQ